MYQEISKNKGCRRKGVILITLGEFHSHIVFIDQSQSHLGMCALDVALFFLGVDIVFELLSALWVNKMEKS